MNKQFFFISGLPRSGSSLLCNILSQNPDAYASPTSGLPNLLSSLSLAWDNIGEFKANSNIKNKEDVILGIIEGYYKQYNNKYIFSKCRTWPKYIETLENSFNKKPKVILCVRDVRDILSSWEKLYRKDKKKHMMSQWELEHPLEFQSIELRFKYWAQGASTLGSSFNTMKDAFDHGYEDCMHYFEFEKWTHSPIEEFNRLYTWLGIPEYKHDFNNIKQLIHEDDSVYKHDNLHTIKEGKLIPSTPQWPEYMSDESAKYYESSNIWKQ